MNGDVHASVAAMNQARFNFDDVADVNRLEKRNGTDVGRQCSPTNPVLRAHRTCIVYTFHDVAAVDVPAPVNVTSRGEHPQRFTWCAAVGGEIQGVECGIDVPTCSDLRACEPFQLTFTIGGRNPLMHRMARSVLLHFPSVRTSRIHTQSRTVSRFELDQTITRISNANFRCPSPCHLVTVCRTSRDRNQRRRKQNRAPSNCITVNHRCHQPFTNMPPETTTLQRLMESTRAAFGQVVAFFSRDRRGEDVVLEPDSRRSLNLVLVYSIVVGFVAATVSADCGIGVLPNGMLATPPPRTTSDALKHRHQSIHTHISFRLASTSASGRKAAVDGEGTAVAEGPPTETVADEAMSCCIRVQLIG
ncbi:hypothetical protein R4P64_33445 [Rhodococcus sp. IEGM 1366]|nr:hypothetical protein [Rhodococcus sp. IEGM 1366]MDV8071419.1 hypothetical protein [Rhodococcus sp. IEGM 1366]